MKKAPVIEKSAIATAGHAVTEITARFSPQMLGLFSDHLYSSANKAFEELVTNSWDAQATTVYVTLPEDLKSENAAIFILDNGNSMDVDGLQQMWSIAESNKRTNQLNSGRRKIGKFGIGKLATYTLCNELTYICKAKDSTIRIVTMDYREIDDAKEKHLNALPLSVRELNDLTEIEATLKNYSGGLDIFSLIEQGIPPVKFIGIPTNEYGGDDPKPETTDDTWTIAILTSLKTKGKNLQRGWIKRLISTALPLGNSMGIQVNEEPIYPSKLDQELTKIWQIGPELDFEEITLDNDSKLKIQKSAKPYPHIKIEHVGEVTGTITFFEKNISGGKSEKMESSNGFFVNVLGRVINYEDNQFKLPHLNHTIFNRLRVAVRADGLDKDISVNRESISESLELSIVRALLHSLFNMARREESRNVDKNYSDLALVRKDNIDALPLSTLSSLLNTAQENIKELPPFVDVGGNTNAKVNLETWSKETSGGEKQVVNDIEFKLENSKDDLYKYDITNRTLIINSAHPFVQNNFETKEQKQLLQDIVTADLLGDAFLLTSGIPKDVCLDYFWHRDRSRRLVTQIRRRTAAQLIQLLNDWQDKAKPYEEIVGDALEYLGFEIQRLAKSGEPEGIATAFISPSNEERKSVFSLTFDAKSTKHKAVQTGNIHIAALAKHRDQYNANYALVVAPNFQDGGLEHEARSNKVTPITGKTLAKLVAITVGYGPINLENLKEVFQLFTPDAVEKWVFNLEQKLEKTFLVKIPTLVVALQNLVTPNRIDRITFSVVAQKYRELSGDEVRPNVSDVSKVFQGLALLMPSAIGLSGNDAVIIFTRPDMLIWEMKRQLEIVSDGYKIGSLLVVKTA